MTSRVRAALRAVAFDWARFRGSRVHPLRLALELAASAWALWPIAVLIGIFASRLTYPMDLEWCEGGILYQAKRLLDGLPVYPREDPSWAPFPYPPAHTLLVALVGLIDLDFWSGRAISVFWFGVLCVTLFREIYTHFGKSSFGVASGLLALGSIACAYPLLGQWYDLIRVDTMLVALVAIFVARAGRVDPSPRHVLLTAVCMTAAFYTKQIAAPFAAWACAFAFVRSPRVGVQLAFLTFVLSLVVLAVLQLATGGGYWYWTIGVMERHKIEDLRLVQGLKEVLGFAPFLAVLPFGLALLALRRSLSARSILWTGTLMIAVPMSVISYAKVGGYQNNLMPIVVLAGPVLVLLAGDLIWKDDDVGAIARYVLLAGLSLFLYERALEPQKYVPTADDRRAAARLEALAASLSGGLVVPQLGFLSARTGHDNLHWHVMPTWDLEWAGTPMDQTAAFEKTGARWVMLHSDDVAPFPLWVRKRFIRHEIPERARVRMLTGAAIGLDEYWERPPNKR
jgi:hypothetical protein